MTDKENLINILAKAKIDFYIDPYSIWFMGNEAVIEFQFDKYGSIILDSSAINLHSTAYTE